MSQKIIMSGIQTKVPKEVFEVLDRERGNFSMSGYIANLLIIYTEEITRDRKQTNVPDVENSNMENRDNIEIAA